MLYRVQRKTFSIILTLRDLRHIGSFLSTFYYSTNDTVSRIRVSRRSYSRDSRETNDTANAVIDNLQNGGTIYIVPIQSNIDRD